MAGGEIDTDTEMTGATSFKDTTKKRGVRGGVDYVVKKVDRLINGEPVDMLPPSVRKAARTATVDDFRAQMHNTRDTEGRKLLRWRRKGEKLEPEFKNVYPKL
jgi:hypothetical protein